MMRRPAAVALTLGAALAAGLLVAACRGDAEPQAMLPAVSPAGVVPVGDPAGPAERRAERVTNPYANDPVALQDGERLYRQMNCADCHGYSGTGGMGPSLVDGEWLFGDTPIDRFMSVYGGRARGMPAYGHLLPDEAIWKVVAYIEELGRRSGEPGRGGGQPPRSTRQGQQPQGGRH